MLHDLRRRFGVLQRSRVDEPVLGDRESQCDGLRRAIAGVAPQILCGQPEPAVPFDLRAQAVCLLLDLGVLEARVEYERLDIVQGDRAVDVGLDVVVERVLVVGVGDLDQRHAVRGAEVDRVEDAVGVAERDAVEHGFGEAQVGRAEPRCAALRPPAVVECAVLGPFGWSGLVVGAAEEPALPLPARAAGVRGEAAVAGAGLELRAVDAVPREPGQHAAAGVEVERDPQITRHRSAGRAGRDVVDRLFNAHVRAACRGPSTTSPAR